VTLIVGLQSAMLQPLIAIAAHLHSRGEKRQLGMLLTDASRINTLVFLAAIAPLFVAGEWLTKLWVGDLMAQHVLPIVQVLLLGVLLRQTLAPFAVILLGTGEQRLVVWTPAYEAAAKLVSSIGLGIWLGPVGVALGTVVGAIVCVTTNLTLVFPRVSGFAARRRTFLMHDIATPMLAFVPILVLPLFGGHSTTSTALVLTMMLAALVTLVAAAMALASLRRLRAFI
jgi:O-antigen/teichoic acid export membrane protein